MKSAPEVVCLEKNRPSKWKQWEEENMIAAMESASGGMSVNQAAERHGIPTTTLQDCVKGNVLHGVNPGPKLYLLLMTGHVGKDASNSSKSLPNW